MSSTRSKRKPTEQRASSGLAQLRAARAAKGSGVSRIHLYEPEEAETLYEEIDDDDRLSKKLRRDDDDFVEDDDGRGYVYDGHEEEIRDYSNGSSDEEIVSR
ncbi:hypothetical protein BGZ76_001415, partial [Entomortierella beljakovae]